MTREEQAQDAFLATRQGLHNALTALQDALAGLPSPDLSDPCCEAPELFTVTVGLEQWARTEHDQGGLTAHTNGWQDMGDMSGPNFIVCMSCDTHFSVPERLDWA